MLAAALTLAACSSDHGGVTGTGGAGGLAGTYGSTGGGAGSVAGAAGFAGGSGGAAGLGGGPGGSGGATGLSGGAGSVAGAAGTDENAGTTGGGVAGAAGGTGAADGGSSGCYPACLENLTAPCPLAASCVAQASSAPLGSNLCFAGGVTLQSVPVSTTSGTMTTSTVKASGGALCYTLEIDGVGLAPIAYVYNWKDAGGTEVAIGTVNPSAPEMMVITCGSTTTTVDTGAAACAGQTLTPPSASSCLTGVCAF